MPLMEYRQEIDTYIIKLRRGEELISRLRDFCQEQEIYAGVFSLIGACDDITLAFYDLPRQEYLTKQFPAPHEAVSLTGNIAIVKNSSPPEILVHAHGVFSNAAMQTVGGHVVKAHINAAAEIFLRTFPDPLIKEHDPETGLKLLNLNNGFAE